MEALSRADVRPIRPGVTLTAELDRARRRPLQDDEVVGCYELALDFVPARVVVRAEEGRGLLLDLRTLSADSLFHARQVRQVPVQALVEYDSHQTVRALR